MVGWDIKKKILGGLCTPHTLEAPHINISESGLYWAQTGRGADNFLKAAIYAIATQRAITDRLNFLAYAF